MVVSGFVFWVFASAAVGLAAKAFSKSGAFYTILGLILSPVVSALVLVLFSEDIKCGACLGYIEANAKKCRHCGERIAEKPVQAVGDMIA